MLYEEFCFVFLCVVFCYQALCSTTCHVHDFHCVAILSRLGFDSPGQSQQTWKKHAKTPWSQNWFTKTFQTKIHNTGITTMDSTVEIWTTRNRSQGPPWHGRNLPPSSPQRLAATGPSAESQPAVRTAGPWKATTFVASGHHGPYMAIPVSSSAKKL